MLGVVGSVVFVSRETQPWESVGVLALSVAVLALVIAVLDRLPSPVVATANEHRAGNRQHEPLVPVWLLVTLLLAVLLTAVAMNDLMVQSVGVQAVTFRWLISIGLLVLCGWWHLLPSAVRFVRGHRRFAITFPPPGIWGPWIGIMAIAAIPRLILLDRYPTVIIGDEAQFMLMARTSQQGLLPNPYGTGFFSQPHLYPVVQGWIATYLGSDLAAHRVLSAAVGTVGVMATWRVGRYLVGQWSATIGAVILAVMPLSLLFSRSALNNITDPATIMLALLFLLRSVRFSRRRDAIVCGVVLGLGFYGYYGGRAIPIVVLVLLPILAAQRRIGFGATARIGVWIVAGFFTTAMPLIVYFLSNPAPFAGHLNQVSAISLSQMRDDPGTAIPLYLDNVWDAVMLPWVSNFYIFFNRDAPYLGWTLALLLALGVAVWIARGVQGRDITAVACLAVPWGMLAAGVALTTPVGGHRLLVLTPLWALAAGSGLVFAVGWCAKIWRPAPGPALRFLIVVLVAVVATNEVRWLATEERHSVYVDQRGVIAWDLGWRLSQPDAALEAQPSVRFAGPPMMFSDGWGNLRFLVPDLDIVDVVDPLSDASGAPDLPDGTMVVLIAERAEERCAAERIYRGATVAEVRAQDDSLLYIAFFREPLIGWSTATTPAETTFNVITDSTCPA